MPRYADFNRQEMTESGKKGLQRFKLASSTVARMAVKTNYIVTDFREYRDMYRAAQRDKHRKRGGFTRQVTGAVAGVRDFHESDDEETVAKRVDKTKKVKHVDIVDRKQGELGFVRAAKQDQADEAQLEEILEAKRKAADAAKTKVERAMDVSQAIYEDLRVKMGFKKRRDKYSVKERLEAEQEWQLLRVRKRRSVLTAYDERDHKDDDAETFGRGTDEVERRKTALANEKALNEKLEQERKRRERVLGLAASEVAPGIDSSPMRIGQGSTTDGGAASTDGGQQTGGNKKKQSLQSRMETKTAPFMPLEETLAEYVERLDNATQNFFRMQVKRLTGFVKTEGGDSNDLLKLVRDLIARPVVQQKLVGLRDKEATLDNVLGSVERGKYTGFGCGANKWILMVPRVRNPVAQVQKYAQHPGAAARKTMLFSTQTQKLGGGGAAGGISDKAKQDLLTEGIVSEIVQIKDPSEIMLLERRRNRFLLMLPYYKKYNNLDTLARFSLEVKLATAQQERLYTPEQTEILRARELAKKFRTAEGAIPDVSFLYPAGLKGGYVYALYKEYVLQCLERLNLIRQKLDGEIPENVEEMLEEIEKMNEAVDKNEDVTSEVIRQHLLLNPSAPVFDPKYDVVKKAAVEVKEPEEEEPEGYVQKAKLFVISKVKAGAGAVKEKLKKMAERKRKKLDFDEEEEVILPDQIMQQEETTAEEMQRAVDRMLWGARKERKDLAERVAAQRRMRAKMASARAIGQTASMLAGAEAAPPPTSDDKEARLEVANELISWDAVSIGIEFVIQQLRLRLQRGVLVDRELERELDLMALWAQALGDFSEELKKNAHHVRRQREILRKKRAQEEEAKRKAKEQMLKNALASGSMDTAEVEYEQAIDKIMNKFRFELKARGVLQQLGAEREDHNASPFGSPTAARSLREQMNQEQEALDRVQDGKDKLHRLASLRVSVKRASKWGHLRTAMALGGFHDNKGKEVEGPNTVVVLNPAKRRIAILKTAVKLGAIMKDPSKLDKLADDEDGKSGDSESSEQGGRKKSMASSTASANTTKKSGGLASMLSSLKSGGAGDLGEKMKREDGEKPASSSRWNIMKTSIRLGAAFKGAAAAAEGSHAADAEAIDENASAATEDVVLATLPVDEEAVLADGGDEAGAASSGKETIPMVVPADDESERGKTSARRGEGDAADGCSPAGTHGQSQQAADGASGIAAEDGAAASGNDQSRSAMSVPVAAAPAEGAEPRRPSGAEAGSPEEPQQNSDVETTGGDNHPQELPSASTPGGPAGRSLEHSQTIAPAGDESPDYNDDREASSSSAARPRTSAAAQHDLASLVVNGADDLSPTAAAARAATQSALDALAAGTGGDDVEYGFDDASPDGPFASDGPFAGGRILGKKSRSGAVSFAAGVKPGALGGPLDEVSEGEEKSSSEDDSIRARGAGISTVGGESAGLDSSTGLSSDGGAASSRGGRSSWKGSIRRLERKIARKSFHAGSKTGAGLKRTAAVLRACAPKASSVASLAQPAFWKQLRHNGPHVVQKAGGKVRDFFLPQSVRDSINEQVTMAHRMRMLDDYAICPLNVAEYLDKLYVKFRVPGQKRNVTTNFPLPDQRFLCFEFQVFDHDPDFSIVQVGFAVKPSYGSKLPGEFQTSLGYTNLGNVFKFDEDDDVAQVVKTDKGFGEEDIVTCLIDREVGMFNFYVNRDPIFQKFQFFKPLHFAAAEPCYVAVGVRNSATIRMDFGAYGYSAVTNAVIWREERMRAQGLDWHTCVFGEYADDREQIDVNYLRTNYFKSQEYRQKQKQAELERSKQVTGDDVDLVRDCARSLSEKLVLSGEAGDDDERGRLVRKLAMKKERYDNIMRCETPEIAHERQNFLMRLAFMLPSKAVTEQIGESMEIIAERGKAFRELVELQMAETGFLDDLFTPRKDEEVDSDGERASGRIARSRAESKGEYPTGVNVDAEDHVEKQPPPITRKPSAESTTSSPGGSGDSPDESESRSPPAEDEEQNGLDEDGLSPEERAEQEKHLAELAKKPAYVSPALDRVKLENKLENANAFSDLVDNQYFRPKKNRCRKYPCMCAEFVYDKDMEDTQICARCGHRESCHKAIRDNLRPRTAGVNDIYAARNVPLDVFDYLSGRSNRVFRWRSFSLGVETERLITADMKRKGFHKQKEFMIGRKHELDPMILALRRNYYNIDTGVILGDNTFEDAKVMSRPWTHGGFRGERARTWHEEEIVRRKKREEERLRLEQEKRRRRAARNKSKLMKAQDDGTNKPSGTADTSKSKATSKSSVTQIAPENLDPGGLGSLLDHDFGNMGLAKGAAFRGEKFDEDEEDDEEDHFPPGELTETDATDAELPGAVTRDAGPLSDAARGAEDVGKAPAKEGDHAMYCLPVVDEEQALLDLLPGRCC